MIYTPAEAIGRLPGILASMKSGMAASQSASFFLSAPMILPRIALEKWKLADERGILHIITDDGIIILSRGGQGEYYSDVTSMMRPGNTLLRVPAWMANHLKKSKTTFQVTAATTEYMMLPEILDKLPGGRLGRVRKYVNGAAKVLAVTTDLGVTTQNISDIRELNDSWYRDANKRMFRTYEKKNIDWCLDNWDTLKNADPTVQIAETRHKETNQLEVFQIGLQLCAGISTGYCDRYRREGVTGASLLSHGKLALALKEPLENNGTADSAGIRANKEKISDHTIKTFNIKVPRR